MSGNLKQSWWRGPFAALSITIFLLLVSSDAQAGKITGNNLYEDCARGNEGQLYCFGYIAGILDALNDLDPFHVMGEAHVCLPAKVTMGLLRDVVMQYLTAHPELRDQEGAWQLVRAYHKAFPCK